MKTELAKCYLANRAERRASGNPACSPRQAYERAKRGIYPMERNPRYLDHGDVIRIRTNGAKRSFVVIHTDDEDSGPPWENCEGHGPVSDWTSRDKYPGEIVLYESHGSKRYYDFQEAIRLAKRDGWNAKPYDIPGETKGQRAVKAVKADYEFLRAWYNDVWRYIGVTVAELPRDREIDVSSLDYESVYKWPNASLWGIESCSGEYLGQVAWELVTEV